MLKLNIYFYIILSFFCFLPGGNAWGDIYAYRDTRGVMTFTNARSHSGYRMVLKEASRGLTVSAGPKRYVPIVRWAAKRYGVDPHLVWAVIKVESDFNPQAISHKGARGLMQLMPATARMHAVKDIHDPNENIRAGVRHLRLVLDRFKGNLRLGLAAYNAGIKAVEKYRNVPPYSETKKYIKRVLRYYNLYRSQGTVLAGYESSEPKTY